MSHFDDLLLSYTQTDSQLVRQEIEAQWWAEYGTEAAILVLALSGSARTQRHGLLHRLATVRQLQLVPPPIVARYHGQVIECHAGRCFARFAESADAIAAAIALQLVVSNMPHTAPDEQPLHITCGIDFGRFLCVDERHVFGTPVSRAQQLGPGVAKVEILAK